MSITANLAETPGNSHRSDAGHQKSSPLKKQT
jgi:hypothetical protein